MDFLAFGYGAPAGLLAGKVLRADAQRWCEATLEYDWCIGRWGLGEHLSVLFESPGDCDAFFDHWQVP